MSTASLFVNGLQWCSWNVGLDCPLWRTKVKTFASLHQHMSTLGLAMYIHSLKVLDTLSHPSTSVIDHAGLQLFKP